MIHPDGHIRCAYPGNGGCRARGYYVCIDSATAQVVTRTAREHKGWRSHIPAVAAGPQWRPHLRFQRVRRRWALYRPPRVPLVLACFLFVVGSGLLFLGTPSWWLGGALIWAAVSLARSSGDRPWAPVVTWLTTPRATRFGTVRPGAVLLESAYMGLVVATAVTMLFDVFAGERPVSHDHTVHYFKAFQLHKYFLPEGRLFGWSPRMFAGYPVNYLYPIGADLWVNLCHALGLGLLSFSRAYGLAFVAFFVLLGLSGYRFGRSLGGPHVGVLTGLLLLTDLSDFRLGGWAYTVESLECGLKLWVWPSLCSL